MACFTFFVQMGGNYARDGGGEIQCDSPADDVPDPPTNTHADYDDVDGAFAAPSSRGHSPSKFQDTLDGGLSPRNSFRFGNARGSTVPRLDDLPRSRSSSFRSNTSPRRSNLLSSGSSPSSSSPQDSPSSSPSEEALECPRCHDKFPFELHVDFLDHIDVCTSY